MATMLTMRENSVLARAMTRYKERAAAQYRPARIGFLVDATASRQKTWKEAQIVPARMFKAAEGLGTLNVRIAHFGGKELTDVGW